MGAGKGKKHRAKSASTKVSMKKPSKPEFGIDDIVTRRPVDRRGTDDHDSSEQNFQRITEIVYSKKQNTYYYWTDKSHCYQNGLTLVKSALPNDQNQNLNNYFHKTVTFQCRSDRWSQEMKQLDGQKAHINGIEIRDEQLAFQVDFYEAGTHDNYIAKGCRFLEEDLQSVVQTIDTEELNNVPSF